MAPHSLGLARASYRDGQWDNRPARMLSDEGVTMLGRRRHHKLHRSGTVIGLKGDCYVVHWDGNAEQTVRPYARRHIKIIQPAPRRG